MSLTLIPARAASISIDKIDFQMAQSILDRLGYNLQDLSLDYGDVVIPDGDISHQIWYGSIDNSFNLLGYIWVENDIYFVSGNTNYRTAEEAALELIDIQVVKNCQLAIESERAYAIDYM